jgi:quinol monooxygenase YgiN
VAEFAQHTRIQAKPGRGEALRDKFVEAADMQRDNPACELTLVSASPADPDVIFLTEVWASEADHEHARNSPEVQEWAKEMPDLVDGPPQTTALDPVVIR